MPAIQLIDLSSTFLFENKVAKNKAALTLDPIGQSQTFVLQQLLY